jgi:site-specific recombinase XerD
MIGSLAQATSAYKTIAVSNGLSARTIEWVVSSARYLQEFLGDEVQLEDISTQDVKRWILAMRQRRCWTGHPVKNPRPLSATSINNYVRGVKILLSTLAREGFIPPHPVAGIPGPKPAKVAIKPYSEGELRRIQRDATKGLIFGINRQHAWQVVRECAERAGLPSLVNPETGRMHGVSPHRLRDAFAVMAVRRDDSTDGIGCSRSSSATPILGQRWAIERSLARN